MNATKMKPMFTREKDNKTITIRKQLDHELHINKPDHFENSRNITSVTQQVYNIQSFPNNQ